MTLAPLSYSLVIMMKDRIYGVRDVYGNRPLCIGKIVPVDAGKRKCEKKQSFQSYKFTSLIQFFTITQINRIS